MKSTLVNMVAVLFTITLVASAGDFQRDIVLNQLF